MGKPKKRKVTAYLAQRSLDALVCAGDTAELNYALASFAGLVFRRGCELAGLFSPQQWAWLRDALDNDCWELPQDGETWRELVFNRVEHHFIQVYGEGFRASKKGVSSEAELLAMLAERDDLDAVVILTAVRYCERLGPNLPPGGGHWWEPSARLRRKPAEVSAECRENQRKASKRRKSI